MIISRRLMSRIPNGVPTYRLVNARCRSGSSGNDNGDAEAPQLIEVDLGAENNNDEIEVFTVNRLEEAIRGMVVRRSAPRWLPFLPGSSYWVPPPDNPGRMVDIGDRLSDPLTEEEVLSLTTARGWPSSAYYIQGASSHPLETLLQQKEKSEKEEED
eukprot:Gb_25277 [translate_table: standard]